MAWNALICSRFRLRHAQRAHVGLGVVGLALLAMISWLASAVFTTTQGDSTSLATARTPAQVSTSTLTAAEPTSLRAAAPPPPAAIASTEPTSLRAAAPPRPAAFASLESKRSPSNCDAEWSEGCPSDTASFLRATAGWHELAADFKGADCCSGGVGNERCTSKCWFGRPRVVLSREQFLTSPITQSCCRTPNGGVPLDLTLRQRVFATKPNGFFIESGGQDGLFQSNTIVAERLYGWNGLLIEPSKVLAPLCREVREPASLCITAALVSYGGPSFVRDPGGAPGDQIGIFKGNASESTDRRAIAAFPISVILAKNGVRHVDLWSLDIEGYELAALKGLNWTNPAHRPTWILIECRPAHHQEMIFEHMLAAGYAMAPGLNGRLDVSGWAHNTDHRDYLWKNSGVVPTAADALRAGLMAPPNVGDDNLARNADG